MVPKGVNGMGLKGKSPTLKGLIAILATLPGDQKGIPLDMENVSGRVCLLNERTRRTHDHVSHACGYRR